MHEMLRHRTPGPLGLIHRTTEDTKLMGYDIPKVEFTYMLLAGDWRVGL